jgi:hypothetical protein
VLLPLLTVISVHRCEEDVIVAYGLYLLSTEEKREKRKQVRTQNFPLGGGDDFESVYNLCLILKIML